MNTLILLDTSFLTAAVDAKVDIPTELAKEGLSWQNVTIIDMTVAELLKLAMTGKKEAVKAKIALETLKKLKMELLEHITGYVDQDLLEFAASNGLIVATQDKSLKKQLHALGVLTLCIRQRRYIAYG